MLASDLRVSTTYVVCFPWERARGSRGLVLGTSPFTQSGWQQGRRGPSGGDLVVPCYDSLLPMLCGLGADMAVLAGSFCEDQLLLNCDEGPERAVDGLIILERGISSANGMSSLSAARPTVVFLGLIRFYSR